MCVQPRADGPSRRTACSADRGLERSRSPPPAPTPATGRQETANPSRELLPIDLALELDDPVDERFGTGRASRNEHVDRHNLVDALDERIVVEDAANRRARAHRQS